MLTTEFLYTHCQFTTPLHLVTAVRSQVIKRFHAQIVGLLTLVTLLNMNVFYHFKHETIFDSDLGAMFLYSQHSMLMHQRFVYVDGVGRLWFVHDVIDADE